MERTTIASIFADPASYGDAVVSCCGWVRSVRDMKNFGFVTLMMVAALKIFRLL